MTFDDFENQSNRKFKDISSEEFREYYRAGVENQETRIRIDNPIALHVSDTAHYVVDEKGKVYRIVFDPARHDIVWQTDPEGVQVVA